MTTADDLRYFYAVATTRRLVTAASVLKVDHTTVGRRINALERTLGRRLFDRRPDGWELTEVGRNLLEPAEAIERAMHRLGDRIDSPSAPLSGRVRVLCPDGFGAFLLAPALGPLLTQHPSLIVELVTATAQLDHSVRDFDVAVTLEPTQSNRVEARKLLKYSLRMYASRDYLQRTTAIDDVSDLAKHRLIGYVDSLLSVAPLQEIQDSLGEIPSLQSTNVVAQWQSVASGLGVAVLPRYIADRDASIAPVLPERQFERYYWIAVAPQHARLNRVRAVIELLDQIATAHRTTATGEEHDRQ